MTGQMTWGMAKTIALQKMFADLGGRIGDDPATAEDTAAMPAAANEAMALLCAAAKPLVRCVQLEKTGEGEARFDLYELAPDLQDLIDCRLYLEEKTGSRPVWYWRLEAERWLVLPHWAEGRYTLQYNALPQRVTGETPDDWPLPLAPDAALLVPLYMASQLCRREDFALSATLRNEFEAGLSRLNRGLGRAGSEVFYSESGWCRC